MKVLIVSALGDVKSRSHNTHIITTTIDLSKSEDSHIPSATKGAEQT